nr:hypothetical protein [Pseudomonas fluorescens]
MPGQQAGLALKQADIEGMEEAVERRIRGALRTVATDLQAVVTVGFGLQLRQGCGGQHADELDMPLQRPAERGTGAQRQVDAIELDGLVVAGRAQTEGFIAGQLDTAQPQRAERSHRQSSFAVLHHRRVDADAQQHGLRGDAVLALQGTGDGAHHGGQGGLGQR